MSLIIGATYLRSNGKHIKINKIRGDVVYYTREWSQEKRDSYLPDLVDHINYHRMKPLIADNPYKERPELP